jgi:membrane-bound lytic murein transglycosylase D
MDDRTRMFCSVFALGTTLLFSGCGYNQQSRFQMSFLPPAPRPAAPGDAAELALPPDVNAPNPYLQQVPAIFVNNPLPPRHKLMADAKVRKADQAYQRGQRLYQAKNYDAARREFDAAIDLMLDASDANPDDREDYENKLDEMVDAIHRYDLSGLGAAAIPEPGQFEKAPLEDILQMTFPVDPRMKDKVREQVTATVSQLPLSVNDTVLGYINYFSNRGHRTLLAGTQRSGRYRPMIRRILDEEGVPQELIHLAQAESGFMPRAFSRKAAGGMWQFLSWRGQQYGLMQTRYTDDRMDPEKATRAAARHLHDLYTVFGDWYLAIAAYNCGPGVVEKAVERTGYADFWELRSRGVLPAETTNYVPIILAMTIMEKHPAEYGLDNLQLDPPIEYDTVEVTAPTSLTLVSDVTDTPLAELASLNPALLRGIAPASFALHLPKGSGNQLIAALQLIPSEHRDSWRLHRVAQGETLAAIGKRYGLSAGSIIAVNSLKTPEAVEGDRLLIPVAARPEAPVKRTASRSSARRGTTQRATGSKRKAPVTVASAR